MQKVNKIYLAYMNIKLHIIKYAALRWFHIKAKLYDFITNAYMNKIAGKCKLSAT